MVCGREGDEEREGDGTELHFWYFVWWLWWCLVFNLSPFSIYVENVEVVEIEDLFATTKIVMMSRSDGLHVGMGQTKRSREKKNTLG